MRVLWQWIIAVSLVICCTSSVLAQQGVSGTSGVKSPAIASSMVLLQSNVGGEIQVGTAVVIKSGDNSLALTSYEAVKGAAKISALVPGQGEVMAHLLKYAPEANLALLELAAVKLPPVQLSDYESMRNKPLVLCSVNPVYDGANAVAFGVNERKGTLQEVITRPFGMILRVAFSPGIVDNTSGAPIVNPATNEVVAISLSLNTSQVSTLRFAVPAIEAAALCPDVIQNNATNISIKVKDGSEAPVKEVQVEQPEQSDSSVFAYTFAIVMGLAIVGIVAFKMRSNKPKVLPFSFLPALPDGMEAAFVTADGKLLPSDVDIIKVGRAPDNTWFFQEKTVSNFHARLRKNKNTGRYEVEDLKSSNGTFVGKRRIISSEPIAPGTIIRFGKTVQVMYMLRSQATEKPAPRMDFNIRKIQ